MDDALATYNPMRQPLAKSQIYISIAEKRHGDDKMLLNPTK